jgi:hypothetical protein
MREDSVTAGALPFGLNIFGGTLSDLECMDMALAKRYPPICGKHYLTAHDAEHLCQINLAAVARVTAVVAVHRSQRGTKWERLEGHDVTLALRAADTAATDPGYQADWLGMNTSASAPHIGPASDMTGWRLDYDPRQQLPVDWVEEAARSLCAPGRNNQ